MSLTLEEKAALQRLEEERDRRMVERLEKGTARLLPPPVVGSADTPLERDGDGIYRGFLSPEGVIERRDRIVTGVPRTGRDCEPTEWHSRQPTVAMEVPDYREPGVRIPQRGTPASDGPWVNITTSFGGKTESDPGRIIQGSYRHRSGGCIEVRAEDGKSVVHPMQPGDSIEVFVRKQLREQYKRGTGDFWDRPVRYR